MIKNGVKEVDITIISAHLEKTYWTGILIILLTE